jgi:hypothetical protein
MLNHSLNLSHIKQFKLPSGDYHYVYTTSEKPSCFFYVYLDESAVTIRKFFDRFNINMMLTYDKILNDLIQNDKTQLVGDELNWFAFNLTLIENSKSFLYMISFNESNSNEAHQSEIEQAQILIETHKLNATLLYEEFVDSLYKTFRDKLNKQKRFPYMKYYEKLISNLLRFKQR